MPSKPDELAEELKRHGLDLVEVLRDTNAETALRAAGLVSGTLEIALRWKLLVENKQANDRMFKGNGALATFEKRINEAHRLKLIDDVTRKDAHLVRRIRNEFAHTREKLHFDSSKVTALAEQLSTYEAATSNQDAFLKAAGSVSDQAQKTVRALREDPA
jgi:hypothetical protein